MSACTHCDDRHRMWHSRLERDVPCTHCPRPCPDCADRDGRGAYCAKAPCACACHKKAADTVAESAGLLVALAGLLAVSDGHEHGQCGRCRGCYGLREGADDTGVCDRCAQDIVIEARAALAAAKGGAA